MSTAEVQGATTEARNQKQLSTVNLFSMLKASSPIFNSTLLPAAMLNKVEDALDIFDGLILCLTAVGVSDFVRSQVLLRVSNDAPWRVVALWVVEVHGWGRGYIAMTNKNKN